MNRCEAVLREAKCDRESDYGWVYDLAKDYLDRLDMFLIYNPDAHIKPRKKMDEIFVDWNGVFNFRDFISHPR